MDKSNDKPPSTNKLNIKEKDIKENKGKIDKGGERNTDKLKEKEIKNITIVEKPPAYELPKKSNKKTDEDQSADDNFPSKSNANTNIISQPTVKEVKEQNKHNLLNQALFTSMHHIILLLNR